MYYYYNSTKYATNRFAVKPEMRDHFQWLMHACVCHSDGYSKLSVETTKVGKTGEENTLYSFQGTGLYGISPSQLSESGVRDEREDCRLSLFYQELSRCVAEDDAIVVRVQMARPDAEDTAVIITSERVEFVSFSQLLIAKTQNILNNESWQYRNSH